MGVNLWGVIYGLKVFVPLMLAQDTECQIVNTASIAGLLPSHPFAAYQVTKHGVVALSENLYHSLAQRKAKVKVSVLCPGMVNTRIMDAARNRPLELENEPSDEPMSPKRAAIVEDLRKRAQAGMSPREVAEHVFRAIRGEQFCILTHPEWKSEIQKRFDHILEER
jgi:short-subunit dehydrogenase